MVKVLKCFNFRSSHILEKVSAEPVCLAFGRKFVFAGTNACSVEVFSQTVSGKCDPVWNRYCFFKTGADVSQIEYNMAGDYVATVERKSSRLSMVVSVKVYLNWHIAHTHDSYRTRVRVAGLGYKSTNVQTDKRLEVVDVTCERQASFIATCQETGNLGIVFDNLIKLYHLVEKTIPNSQTTFLDVIVFLEVNCENLISKISMCEEYLACCSPEYVQVFQIHISNDHDTLPSDPSLQSPLNKDSSKRRTSSVMSSLYMPAKLGVTKSAKMKNKALSQEQPKFSAVGERSSSTPSPAFTHPNKVTRSAIEDDAAFIQWSFDTKQDHDISKPQSTPRSHDTSLRSHDISVRSHDQSARSGDSKTIRLKSLENIGQEDRAEPSLPNIKDLRGGNHLSTGNTVVEQILCQFLRKGDTRWIHVQFVPTYTIGRDMRLEVSINSWDVPVNSSRRHSLVGMSCLMSGPTIGYMYSLIPDPTLISTYTYSEEAQQIVTNGGLVYVMLNEKLEIYTSRCHIAAVHNIEHFDNVTKTCPPASIDVCMCGVQQFFGPRLMAVSSGHAVLFNKIYFTTSEDNYQTRGDESWNVNVMTEPSVAELYQDMVRFGRKNQEKAPHTYEHLLLESHMMLKSSLISQSISQSEVPMINDLLKESAGLLGECYAFPTATYWHLCLPYFTMAELSIVDIVHRVAQRRKLVKANSYGLGLVQYLKYVLFLDEDPINVQEEDGDFILEICNVAMPEKLADVLLFSRLRNMSPELGVKLLKQSSRSRKTVDKRSSTNECLALVSLNLQLCELDHAKALLATIDKTDLIETCVDNHQILHTGMSEFTPLSQLLRCNNPELLIEILVQLYERGTVPMDLALTLLQGKSDDPGIHRNTHVMTYLEALVNDEGRRFSFEEAVCQLCEIYIARLSEWKPPSIRHITSSMKFRLPKGGHFGRRHGWLDQLPPFTGSRSITSTCKYVVPVGDNRRAGIQSHQLLQCQKIEDKTCSCFLCNEDLLKLQSLMCYEEVSPTICNHVLSLLDNKRDEQFISVKVLALVSSNIDDATRLVTDHHPELAAEYGVSVFKTTTDKWGSLLDQLLMKLGTQDTGQDTSPSATSTSSPSAASNTSPSAASNTSPSAASNICTQSIKDVMKEMAHSLKPEDFLKMLPGNGNFFFFLPYIRMCLHFNKSAVLKERFTEIGEHLSSLKIE